MTRTPRTVRDRLRRRGAPDPAPDDRPPRRTPGRRAIATALALTLAVGGLAYVGLGTDDGPGDDRAASPDQPRRPATAQRVSVADAAAKAARTGRKVEVTALRSANSTTWAQPDGLLAKAIHPSPVRAEVDGEWRPIDLGLRRTEDGWEPAVSNTRIVFSAGSRSGDGPRTDDGDDRASRSGARRAAPVRTAPGRTATGARETVRRVSLVKGGAPARPQGAPAGSASTTGTPLVALHVGTHTIQLTWPGPVPTPVIDANRALYPEIFPGADLVLTADDAGFAPLLVIKNREAAAHPLAQQLTYGISSPTLSFRIDPVSGMVGADDPYGDEVAVSPTPLMWDSSGQPAVTDSAVGSSAQPTAPEDPDPVDTGVPTPEEEGPAPAEPDSESDEQTDQENEVLPTVSEDPSAAPTADPVATVPPEPAPEPVRTGPDATLSLPSLNGPSPDSRGEVIESDLTDGVWTLTPDQEFLTDPATVYPVFVDPSVTKPMDGWTTAYNRHPNATFYNGKGFNKGGTHDARVGFESETWGTSRSFFNLELGDHLKGATMVKAEFRLLATYSWSCSPRSMSVHVTRKVKARTNWRNAPKLHNGNKLTGKSFAHGWKAAQCPDDHVKFNVRNAVQKKVNKGADTITFGLRARDEDSQYAWKKFRANGGHPPSLYLVYNRPPTKPTKLDLLPDAKCTSSAPYVRMGSGSVQFSARSTDKDGNLHALNFDLWPTGRWDQTGDLLGATGKVTVGNDIHAASKTTDPFPTSKLTNGTLYSWRVRAEDKADGRVGKSSYAPAKTPCRFVLDTSKPRPPRVTSTDFPDGNEEENGFGSEGEDAIWSKKKFGTPGSFTFRALSTDVVRYEYGFNSPVYTGSINRTAGAAVTVSAVFDNAKPPTAGPNVLHVRVVDGAGNVSEPTKYFFYVTPRDQTDSPGDFTGDDLPDMLVVTKDGDLALYPSQAKSSDTGQGTGDIDYSMRGAYRDNPERDPKGGDGKPLHSSAPRGHFNGALITHNGDIYGGDGLQDLVARVGGRLWVYPGDGYGAVNINKRREILLPEGAPAPADLTQIVAAGDVTGDGRVDFFATVGDALWAFTGYHGATVEQATRLTSTPWLNRDIVSAYDVSGDSVADLVYRSDSGKLMLRKGKPATGGGTDLTSLASAANSLGGADATYGAGNWTVANTPFVMGTPDANSDGVPDIWAVRGDGSVRFHAGSRTALSGDGTEIIGGPTNHWRDRIAIG
ncbi:DNRLRE domain-containing protein [Streptomyces sp. JNUCC 64]